MKMPILQYDKYYHLPMCPLSEVLILIINSNAALFWCILNFKILMDLIFKAETTSCNWDLNLLTKSIKDVILIWTMTLTFQQFNQIFCSNKEIKHWNYDLRNVYYEFDTDDKRKMWANVRIDLIFQIVWAPVTGHRRLCWKLLWVSNSKIFPLI